MKKFTIILMLLWCGAVVAEAAETAQVMEGAPVKLLSGEGEGYRTLRILPAKTEVEVTKAGENFIKVKTMEGQSGWVKSSLLQATQKQGEAGSPVEPALEAAQKDLLAAREQVAKMQNDLAQARIEKEPPLSSLALVALASFVAGMVVGALLLRAHYIKRLHGLRI